MIEKCLKEPDIREIVLEEIVTEESVMVLTSYPFGCYVLNTASVVAEGEKRVQLENRLLEISLNMNPKIKSILMNFK